METTKIKKSKKKFSQSKNLVYASYLFVTAASLLAWNSRFHGNIRGFSLPSLLAILAFGYMWVHYLTLYLKDNYEPSLDTKKTLKITQAFVLLAIFAHPVAIISKLSETGYGLPPASFKNFVGPTGALFISLGTLSFLAFMAFEFKNVLKKRPRVWSLVLKLNDIAMILIILHGFKLGFVINSGGWFRYIWLGYGLSLLYFFYDKYVKKEGIKKYHEGFIVGLVVIMMIFLGLATSGDSRSKAPVNKVVTTTSSSKAKGSNQYDEGFISLIQLSKNDGIDGHDCWVAVDTDVYDATKNPEWKNGQHTPSGGQAKCGQDLTQVIAKSPHGGSVLGQLPIVGKLRIEGN